MSMCTQYMKSQIREGRGGEEREEDITATTQQPFITNEQCNGASHFYILTDCILIALPFKAMHLVILVSEQEQ